MYVGDGTLELDILRWKEVLASYRIDGRPVADAASARRIVEECRWEDRPSILRRTAGLPTITDDNMASEWRADPQTGAQTGAGHTK